MAERSWTFHDGLRLVLMFHEGGQWGAAKQAEWLRITGTTEATPKVMCDHLRDLLMGGGGFAPGSQSAHGDRCLNLLTVGHVLTKQDVSDIQAMIFGNNEELGEYATAEQRGYLRAIRELCGEELADAVAAHEEADIQRLSEKMMDRVRVMLARKRASLD